MNSFAQLIGALTEELSAAPAFAGCRIGPEYPAAAKGKLGSPEILIGIKKAAAGPCDPGDYLGCDASSAPAKGKMLTVTVAYTLLCGAGDGGALLRTLAGELLSFLAFDSAYAFSPVECGELSGDADTGGVRQTVTAALAVVIRA